VVSIADNCCADISVFGSPGYTPGIGGYTVNVGDAYALLYPYALPAFTISVEKSQ
jgi:hypothetical protein